MKIYKEQKGGGAPAPKPAPELKAQVEKAAIPDTGEKREIAALPYQVGEFSDSDSAEKAVWEEALQIMKTSGMKDALAKLLGASNCAPSVRARNRYRLLMAKLCLEADRPDLARPIVEELDHMIEELHLERWESPLWIAEVLDALYQCLTRGEPSDEDKNRGKALFQKLCTTDVTRAMIYKN
jgi:type VI secretion system protein ImpA